MKKGLVFFSILLLFNRCDDVVHTTISIPPGIVMSGGSGRVLDDHDRKSKPADQPSLTKEVPKHGGKRGKKRRNSIRVDHAGSAEIRFRPVDSLFISHLRYLRSQGVEPDLTEPVTKRNLSMPTSAGEFPSMITLSHESFLRISFDNDILDYTDRFYTNGIKIEMISPGFKLNPVSRLMVPYWGSGNNYYGLSLVQNMYTPSTTKTGGILFGDRPYAAYLYVGSFKITNDPVHRFRQTSELDAGIIGSGSYGEWVQKSFHNSVPTNNEPLGWEYQVQNDLVLNYTLAYEKGLLTSRNVEFLVSTATRIGSLYTNVEAGSQLRMGLLNPYFVNLGVAKAASLQHAGLRKTQFFLFFKAAGRFVGYDATLQGGIFNRTSVYTLPASEISRFVFEGSGGITFSHKGIRIDLEQYLLSPEFHNGWWHKWVHIGLTFCL